jgi:hypothetical protein
MNSKRAVFRHLAMRLAAHAEKALPRCRADWARAMRNEIHHISGNRAALIWALGCVFASYRERVRAMIETNPRISRWVLVLEMLCCFTLVLIALLPALGILHLVYLARRLVSKAAAT